MNSLIGKQQIIYKNSSFKKIIFKNWVLEKITNPFKPKKLPISRKVLASFIVSILSEPPDWKDRDAWTNWAKIY